MKLLLQIMRPAIVLALVSGLWGCSESDGPDDPTPVTTFEISDKSVNIVAEGGAGSARYTCENPQEGVTPQATTTADWVNNFDTSANGTITFNVEENPDETERKAEVSVAYADIKDSFTIIQGAADNSKAFKISIDALEGRDVVVSITPKDKEMTYYLGAISVADLNTLPDDLTFVTDYLIPMLQEAASELGMPIEELMNKQLLQSDQSGMKITGLKAETEYYTFCIGMNEKMEILSDFVKVAFTTNPLPAFAAEIDVEVSGPQASIVVTPTDPEIGYFPVVFDEKGHADEDMIAGAQQAIESTLLGYMMFGMSREQAVKAITKYGDQVFTYDLTAEKNYTAAVVAISADGYVASQPTIKEFTAGKTAQSKNVVSVEYTSITGRKAKFIVNVTEPEDTYVFFAYPYADSWKTMSDDEIMKYICEKENINRNLRRGAISSYQDALRQQTEYVIYAFGYSGGNVSTKLFTSTFTTKEAQLNDCKFEYEYGAYYNGDEAAAKYPETFGKAVGKAILPAKYSVTGKWYGIWHKMYAGDMMDKTKYPDEDVYQALRNGGGHPWMTTEVYYLAEYSKIYTFCGFVETEDGNFGELYRQVIGPFTKDGCSPIEDFEPNLSSAQTTSNTPAYRSDYGMQSVKSSVKPAANTSVGTQRTVSDSKNLTAISIVESQGIAIHGCKPAK